MQHDVVQRLLGMNTDRAKNCVLERIIVFWSVEDCVTFRTSIDGCKWFGRLWIAAFGGWTFDVGVWGLCEEV